MSVIVPMVIGDGNATSPEVFDSFCRSLMAYRTYVSFLNGSFFFRVGPCSSYDLIWFGRGHLVSELR